MCPPRLESREPISAVAESQFHKVNLFTYLPGERVLIDVPQSWLAKVQETVEKTQPIPLVRSKRGRANLKRYFRRERAMPLEVLQKLLIATRLDPSEVQGKIKMRVGNCGTRLSIGPVLTIDEELVYVAELIRCDGHIPKNLGTIVFVNKEIRLISIVQKLFEKFGLKRENMNVAIYKGVSFLRVYSRLFALILHKAFEIPLGKKGDMKVPEFVLSSRRLAAAAVRAGFDAEGTVQTPTAEKKNTTRRVVITNISKSYVRCLRKAMGSLSIQSRIYTEMRSSGPIYRLAIYHQDNLRSFAAIIKPLHPKRKAKLDSLLKTYNKNRIPQLSLRRRILFSIHCGNSTRRQIALDTGLSLTRVGNQLYKLRRQHLIAKPIMTWTNLGGFGAYRLTVSGEKFLQGY